MGLSSPGQIDTRTDRMIDEYCSGQLVVLLSQLYKKTSSTVVSGEETRLR